MELSGAPYPRRALLAAGAAAWWAGAARAEEWRGRPLRIIVPYSPGG